MNFRSGNFVHRVPYISEVCLRVCMFHVRVCMFHVCVCSFVCVCVCVCVCVRVCVFV
jgi:hypothetical protein